MKLFLDFDDTLFDTRRFREDLRRVFVGCGVSEEQFHTAYQEIKQTFSGEKLRTYDFDRHVEMVVSLYGVDEMLLRSRVQEFLVSSSRYFFSDTMDFLDAMREAGARIVIVSYGTAKFQYEKIEASGIAKYVDDSVIGGIDKGAEIAKRFSEGDTGWFLEDRVEHIDAAKRANPTLQTILVSRPEGRYHDEKTEYCDFVVRDLREARKVISNSQ